MDDNQPKARIMVLLAFRSFMRKPGARMYAVFIALNPDHPYVAAAREEAGMPLEDGQIPREFEDLEEVFSKTKAQAVPMDDPSDLTIDLMDGKEPQWSPIYNPPAKELKTLCHYIDENLTRG